MAAIRDWMTSREAAKALGVKLETLYAYASRGQLRSVQGVKGRGRRYAREDVERLKARHDARAGHGVVAAGALRWGEPVLDTAISDVRADGPYYRGVSVRALVRDACSFEAVAELLWTSELTVRVAWPDLDARLPMQRVHGASSRWHPIKGLAAQVSAWALTEPEVAAREVEEHARARRLLRASAAVVRGRVRSARGAGVADTLARAFGAKRNDTHVVHAIDRALILCADHELNASTFAARVAASAGASLYASVGAALHTLTGAAHGGMCDQVEALLRDALRARRAADVVRARLASGLSVPGFGHPLYADGDPRGAELFALARAVRGRNARFVRMQAIAEAMERAGQPRPTLDAGLVALTSALELPEGAAAAIFAIGRMAGWVAHALEQRSQGFILRPRARYIGP